MIKRFFEWFLLTERFHGRLMAPPLVSERDLWWISFGENIGTEINGKSDTFSRPGIILKKISRESYLVAPTTSQNKIGTWYIQIQHNEKFICICLHQIRVIDYRRILNRIGVVDEDDFKRIKEAFWGLYR
jgi:mRNA interferase MazF